MPSNLLQRAWFGGRLTLRELLRPKTPVAIPLRARREAALDWLCRAQDVNGDGGVAAGFHLLDGWLPSYPETTGYIAVTFFEQAARDRRPDLARRAWRMIDWLLTRRRDDGAFPGLFGGRSRRPIVFNTGQILLGLTRALREAPGRDDVRQAAIRAARWLTDTQDEDGCWRRHTHGGVPHVYNTRSAWALAQLAERSDEPRFRQAARANLDWSLDQQDADGYFAHAGFSRHEPPFLHTIAYTIEGLLGLSRVLDCPRALEAAARAARPLAERCFRGALVGAYGEGWQEAAAYRCLTGEAQLAGAFADLHSLTGDSRWREACVCATHHVAAAQKLGGPPEFCGALAGSAPIWGRYARYEFPNWAAKFLVDALSAAEEILAQADGAQRGALPCV